jgi:hypothetical protein
MSERKLASIQRIVSLEPIQGADMIEKATVLGWELVVAKKENFKVGDLCVYIEIDSILPDRPEFEFLRERKFRIKTIKIKGQVSQGICFPLSILPQAAFHSVKWNEGGDVTDLLGIKKYDPQAEFERTESLRLAAIDKNRMSRFLKRYSWYRKFIFRPTKTPFPSFIRKTDEDRIQLFPYFYENWSHLTFSVTEKIDGQSGTFFVIRNPKKGLFQKKWIFGVCSRNFQLIKEDNSSYWTIAKQLDLKAKMIDFCKVANTGLIYQGEIIGSKIQGNKYNRTGFELYIFNIMLYNGGKTTYLNQGLLNDFCSKMGLLHVPDIERMKLLPTTPEMVNHAKGNSLLAPVLREGVVMRNYETGISFKVINPDFLLKYSE